MKFSKELITQLLKESFDLLNKYNAAWSDGSLTKEEVIFLKKEASEVINILKVIFGGLKEDVSTGNQGNFK